MTVKRIVANIAAKEVGSAQPFYGDVLERNCVGVLVECPAFFEPVALIETGLQGASDGKTEEDTPEQVVNLLRQIEVAVANGKTTSQACKEAKITEQTYYRWRKEYGGLQVDQARRLVLPIKSFSLPNSPRVKGSRSSS